MPSFRSQQWSAPRMLARTSQFQPPLNPAHSVRLACLIVWALCAALPSATAAVLWERPQATQVHERSDEILNGALAPRDDTANETLYFKFRVNPLSDVVTEYKLRQTYQAGLVFRRGAAEKLGVGNAWDASGYSAFCNTFKFSGNRAGELDLRSKNPEPGGVTPHMAPRRDVFKIVVVKVEYVPGGLDQVTVWLEPDLGAGATEATQSDRSVTRFKADASFDQIHLLHRGGGDGWVFDGIAAATSFEDFVPVPVWQRTWFLTLVGVSLTLVILGGVVARERRRARQQVTVMERERAVTAERVRIAQDLHDDLGAKLTEILLLGELAAKPETNDQSLLPEMLSGLRQFHSSLDEAVWSINPRNDTLAHLIEFLSEFGQRFVQRTPVAFHMEEAEDLPPVRLSASQRHNLLLAVKEALNNAVKHAGATKIWLSAVQTNDGIRITARDDGRGMDMSQATAGDGLRNMRERMEAIGGRTEIRSQPGQGSEVAFTLRAFGPISDR